MGKLEIKGGLVSREENFFNRISYFQKNKTLMHKLSEKKYYFAIKGIVMQIEKPLVNDRLRVSKVS